MKMDTTDKHLLYLLDQNARMSLTKLGSELQISRESVNYRIKKLQRNKIIKTFVTKLNFDRLGLINYVVYLKLNNLHAKEYEKLVTELSEKKYIVWLASIGGKFDLVLEIAAASLAEFDGHYSELIHKHSNQIGSCYVSIRVSQHTFGKKYLWPERTTSQEVKSETALVKIDDIDRKLITAMTENARLSVMEIGNRTKIPPSTVAFRLKQLERSGIIDGYFVFSKLNDYGYSRYKCLVTVRNFSKQDEEKLLKFCRTHEDIYYYAKTLVNWNFEIEVDVKTPMEYQQFLIEFRNNFNEMIQDTESLSIFEEHKFKFWPY
ncbi:putative HTH-type transcriptional regulator [Candidatus Bilamarchaeum dharawalense]|uniref:Putative HTH-type transcriptional regulator n=1 Tax=Candidatus Bilamarchaeum dharawalense TaxID=2885759 RepID=A0A5E4LWC0_9ARCH|nr:putative HTH-type transcriptional regulator [Candidatus Bilamarchaeum dharawalense]